MNASDRAALGCFIYLIVVFSTFAFLPSYLFNEYTVSNYDETSDIQKLQAGDAIPDTSVTFFFIDTPNFFITILKFLFITPTIATIPIYVSFILLGINYSVMFIGSVWIYNKVRGI